MFMTTSWRPWGASRGSGFETASAGPAQIEVTYVLNLEKLEPLHEHKYARGVPPRKTWQLRLLWIEEHSLGQAL